MKFITNSLLAAAVLAMLAGTAHGQILITSFGTPIDGTNSGNLSVTGTSGNQQTQTPPVNMTDSGSNYLSSSDQTFGSISYAGLVGPGIRHESAYHPVLGLQVNFAIFFDGGWFGVNGHNSLLDELNATNNMTQAPLTSADLADLPTMQVTTDGSNWTTVSYTSNYTSQLLGIYHYNEVISPTVTFNLTTPEVGITGIRLIGTSGGNSDFVGISNFQVVAEAPEPSTYAMMLAGLAFLGFCARRKGAVVK